MNHLPLIGPAIESVATFIRFLRDHTGGNLGVTIILFTILIKSLLAPLTFKSIKSSKSMQDVAPIIKDLQKKYKDDKQTFAQEQMRVYQEYGINPLAGCLPVLIQLPVFLVVYQAMRVVSEDQAGGHAFLWVTDLTKLESSADHFRILVFLAFIFQVIQTRMSLPNAAKRAQQDQQTKLQSTLISVSTCLVLVFGWNFLSAMVLYWAVQAVFSAFQQYFITGWGSLSDIFPFLPVKVEKARVLKPVTNKKPSRIQAFMQQSMAAQQDRQVAPETSKGDTGSAAVKPQRLGPDGRPRPGSTLNISGSRSSTPTQHAKADNTNGMNGANGSNGANRPGARNKSGQSRATTKAIGTTDASSTMPPPAPRKSKVVRPASDSIGEQTGSGGS
ncbi:MAG: YidC/Oxa1 family membrane protein insertase [Chloroflexota bacterium]|nr:YidC/Oxa1 family membrane protein insertase [Chloroflexota bacterium]